MMNVQPAPGVLCNSRVFIDDGAYFCHQVEGHLTAHEVLTADADQGGVQVSWASIPPALAKAWEARDRAYLAFNRVKAPSMRRPLRPEPAPVAAENWAARHVEPGDDEEY